MSLKNKRILITAGPTWVPIDSVRVISNIATGETGRLLARKLISLGAKVTLLLGAVESCCLDKKINPALSYDDNRQCRRKGGIKLIRFKFFGELRNRLNKELSAKKYDYIIHSAAISDFKPTRIFNGKLDSQKAISLKLKPLPKVFRDIQRVSPKSRLVMFKLEAGVSDNTLIQRAKAAQHKAGAEFIVANTLRPYRAFVIDRRGNILSANSKNDLVRKLIKRIQFLCL
ncbi:MAG: phosphopantothenoylcysteine decarboxylase [Candidatus Omnitrophica bacterium]|nr:phosphopantothenoylcysteine decarboxylase [Candidatus Omnitrophota bacterium]MDD5592621.1 phosphopantothenoylcysteine decarboxylase [Candidatus Omnitrophota bacterium]